MTEPVTPGAAPAAPAAPATPPAAPATPPAQTPPAPVTPPPAQPSEPVTPPVEPPKTPDPATPPAFKVPDAYKDKPWASKIKSEEDLYKQLDNLDQLAGKKRVVPDMAKATDAEREEYFAQTRPKDVAEYEFPDTPQGPVDPTIKAGVGELLMKNGVSAFQANNIIKGYQQAEQALLAAQFDPAAYKQTMETAFGADWEKVTGATQLALNKHMSPEDNVLLSNLPNTYLAIVHRTLGNIVKAYGIKATDNAHTAPPGAPAPTDINGVRQGLRDQISALSRKPHTAAEKQALIDKLNDTYKPKS